MRSRTIWRSSTVASSIRSSSTNATIRCGRKRAGGRPHSNAPHYNLDKFEVNEGDEVTVFLTNMNDIENLSHGFSIVRLGDRHREISPHMSASVKFKADRPGDH